MAKHIISNVSDGPKVVNAIPPFVLQAAEATPEPVEIDDAEIAVIKARDWFEVETVEGEAADLSKMTVAQLKAFAEANLIDIGDAAKKDDILSAIELALEAKE
ncbi:hypothetical protein [Novosphingobium olei]|uniref:hypothetical protein n=1 Tax=Novosphingobium olei TaxID=2728851 RepID=UPI00308EACFC|nr:hypothetical protein NSDW_11750 [Novosphingobium olei]